MITPDPRYLFMGGCRHRDAIAYLLYGIREHSSFVHLTSEVGSGKLRCAAPCWNNCRWKSGKWHVDARTVQWTTRGAGREAEVVLAAPGALDNSNG